jgi:hypothetical protein
VKFRTKHTTKKELLYWIPLLPLLLFLLWKTKYGYGASDEPFYLTVAHRLIKGDGLIVEEWNLSQLSGALLYPFMKLYYFLHQSTEGILLHFRYVYVLMQVLIGVSLIGLLRKYGKVAYIAAYFFMLFTPYNIMALSYNTMGSGLIVLTGILMATNQQRKKGNMVLSGFLFALAVLCTPHLIFVYVLFTIFLILENLSRRFLKKERDVFFTIEEWFFFSLGCFFPALILLGFIISRSTIREIIHAIPHLLQDSDHSTIGIKRALKTYVIQNWIYFKYYMGAQLILILFLLLDKKKFQRRVVYLLLSVAGCVLQLAYLATQIENTYNFILYPIAWVGFLAYLLTEKKDTRIFIWGYLFGMAYTFCLNWASNQGMFAISMGMVLADVSGIYFLFALFKEHRNKDAHKYPVMKIVLASILLIQFATMMYAKVVHVFWEPPVYTLNYHITQGPLKGTITTKEHGLEYEAILQDLAELKNREQGNVLIIGFQTWGYLYLDMPYGTFSAWSGGESEHLKYRLRDYYRLRPEKTPDYIYLPISSSWNKEELQQLFSVIFSGEEQLEQGYLLIKVKE